MSRLQKFLDSLAGRIERASALDRPAEVLSSALQPLFPDGRVKDLASGTAVGHPMHPALVAVPLGSWLAASWLDVAGSEKDRDAARALVGFGLVAALPSVVTGESDWLYTNGAEQRVGFVHASLNYVAIGLYGASWLTRRRGRHAVGAALAGVGAGVLTASGWLGGHLSYAMGVGVDTTAFEHLPTVWTDVAALDDLTDEPTGVTVDGVPLLLVRRGSRIDALADRCTHRGAPLHEGTVEDGCIVCPWHGSRFRLDDGSVAQGPATRSQPLFKVKVDGGRVLVRRDEQRSLRTNPVGA